MRYKFFTRNFFSYLFLTLWLGGIFVFPSASFSQVQDPDLSLLEKKSLLQKVLDQKSIDIQNLKSLVPQAWFEQEDLTEEKQKIIEELDSLHDHEKDKKELLSLTLRLLDLGLDTRKKIIKESQMQSLIDSSLEKSDRNVNRAEDELDLHERNKKHLKNKIHSSENVGKEILQFQILLENKYENLTQYRKKLAENMAEKSLELSQWKKRRDETLESIQLSKTSIDSAKVGLWKDAMASIYHALETSNKTIFSRQLTKLPKTSDFETTLLEVPSDLLSRIENPKDKESLEHLRQRQREFSDALIRFSLEKQKYIESQFRYEKTLRFLLKDFRSNMLADEHRDWRDVANKFNPSPFSSIYLELETIAGDSMFVFELWRYQWSSKSEVHNSIGQYAWTWVIRIKQWFKLILLIIGLYLVLRWKDGLIQTLSNWTRSWVSGTWSTAFGRWVVTLIDNFYVFLVIGLAGFFLISLAMDSGFSQAQKYKPYLYLFLQYFLLRGLLESLVPMISQRKYQSFGQSKSEILAIEATFRLIPFYVLRIWVIWKGFFIFLGQFFAISFLSKWIGYIAWICLPCFIFVAVHRNRDQWRQTCRSLSPGQRWQKWLDRAKGKVWEPLLLLLGGSFGVYLIAWRRIGKRIVDTQLTKSFQAMVSRAILERSKKQKATKIDFSQLPEGYEDIFGPYSLWKDQWHIDRKDISEDLMQSYEKWKSAPSGKTSLLMGERGIGKTAIVEYFLQQCDGESRRARIPFGSYRKEKLFDFLCQEFFDQKYETENQMIDALNQMEPTVFVLERIENAVLRKVGGFDAFSFLMNIMLKAKKHFWFCTINVHTWGFLQHAMTDMNCFSYVYHVKGLSEDHIKDMILKRNREFNLNFDFSQFSYKEKSRWSYKSWDQKKREKDLYFRILWDFTKGNPREALFFWSSSLQVSQQDAKVLLFDVPETSILDDISDQGLMLLSAIAEHNGLSKENLCFVLRIQEDVVERLLESLDVHGIVFENKRSQTLHLDSFWYRSVTHYLLRRNLLYQGVK
ncbi:MAG: hypothetical protein KDD52_08280 [Bdellovibrionales bacterium]|nr:hypothetical protein [Bdellovibrionales bacterium]